MKAMAGPITISAANWTCWLFARGCDEFVMKIATGPLISGTTQLLMGREMEAAAPPTIIWQNNVEGSAFGKVDMSNVREVPTPTVPLLVTLRVGLAGTPKSQPG